MTRSADCHRPSPVRPRSASSTAGRQAGEVSGEEQATALSPAGTMQLAQKKNHLKLLGSWSLPEASRADCRGSEPCPKQCQRKGSEGSNSWDEPSRHRPRNSSSKPPCCETGPYCPSSISRFKPRVGARRAAQGQGGRGARARKRCLRHLHLHPKELPCCGHGSCLQRAIRVLVSKANQEGRCSFQL